MIRLSKKEGNVVVDSDVGDLAPRNESQLAYWGFSSDGSPLRFTASVNNAIELVTKVLQYFEQRELSYEVDPPIQGLLDQSRLAKQALEVSLLHGAELKRGDLANVADSEFRIFLDKHIPRKLKDHQFKSALHLLSVTNGANFSVPGSGKTTVVLSVFHMLRQKGIVDALFVVGPPSCFTPWRDEYEETLGVVPTYEIFAGGNIEERHSRYLIDANSVCDLYLTSYQTLCRDSMQVQTLFSIQDIRFFYVIDEAHYIKQPDGAWASAALQIARFSERRCILTGTPFPKSYSDAFNLFDVLWPESPPISPKNKQEIAFHTSREEYDIASNILQNSIGPLFYRVRKLDLGLAPQMFLEPIIVPMNEQEKRVYDSILDKIKIISKSDYFRDLDLTIRLRRGRMMRLRQCLSYTKLLESALDDYDENLFEDDLSLAKLIHDYDNLEIPGKLETLVGVVSNLRSKGEKVVIWSNFVKTLELIKKTISNLGHDAHLIYGPTPRKQSENANSEYTREALIKEFVSRESGIDVLVANPAACAESISLHKTCSNAIYYDLSYNCAQYLQSLDRIHRVGGSESKKSYYHFLQYRDTIDRDILRNLNDKADRISLIIDKDYPIYSLDMFDQDDDIVLYEKLFNHEQ